MNTGQQPTNEGERGVRPSRRAVLGTLAGVGTSALAGCAGSIAGGSTGAQFTLGYQPFSAHAWEAPVIKHANLAEKYLPEAASVTWQPALQGAVIGNRMSVGKNQVGWMGDMPALTTISQNETPVSLVGLANWSIGQQCNLLVVPRGSDVRSVTDLDGETVGVTTGSCTHRFLLELLEEEGIDVTFEDTSITTILANLREGRIAAGAGWEPSMARSVFQERSTQYLVTGAEYDLIDAGGLPMTDSLIEEDPEAAKAILKAELEATHIMATDPERTLDLVAQEEDLRFFNRSTLRWGVYRDPPIGQDVDRVELATDYERAQRPGELMKRTAPEFLVGIGALDSQPGPDRYKPGILNQAATELAEEVPWDPRSPTSPEASS